jgi:hypothetical protein
MLDSILQSISMPVAVAMGVGALVLPGLSLWWWRRWHRDGARRRMDRAVQAVSVEMLRDVLVPDGMGGQIHLERLLLTAHGLVVLDLKDVPGAVFASDRMDDWTVIHTERRYSFPNPQGPLFDRVAAVRQLARDIPVAGHVLFSDRADLSKGRPKTVLQPADLLARYEKPAKADLTRLLDAFYPHWERVRRETVSARVGALLGSGSS